MGLQDRDYLRDSPPPPRRPARSGGGLGLPLWSVTTWIIVVTSAIFLVDRFLPPAFAPDGTITVLNPELAARWASVPAANRVVGEPEPPRGWQANVTESYRGPVETPQGTAEVEVPVLVVHGIRVPPIQKWLQFTTGQAIIYRDSTFGLVGFEFWRFIGYMFLHADVTHLLFNMIGLFFFGPIVENYLGGKRYFAFYLLCGIFGAALFMLLNIGGLLAKEHLGSVPPGLLPNAPFAPLIGASAGVFGVIFAAAYLMPNATVYLFGILPMRLRTLAFGLVAFAVVTVLMKGNNAGGEAAHLGGAIAGAWFIRRPHQLHGFFDGLGRADPTSRSNKVRKAARSGTGPSSAEIDRILDKVRERGLASLDARERATLREASRRD
jgi:membrane associated rhomboid family serine protease